MIKDKYDNRNPSNIESVLTLQLRNDQIKKQIRPTDHLNHLNMNINNPSSPINYYRISRAQDQIRVNEWFHLHFGIQKQPLINQTEIN